MVVGMDVYNNISQREKSVGGFVSSLNKTCSRYYSQVSFFNQKENMSPTVAANLLGKFDQLKVLGPNQIL